jgi:3-deoxy-D-manno-octulosonic-acid transferase
VNHGGQNVLEPAYYSKCVLTGSHGFNFHEVIAMMKSEDCLYEVQDVEGLIDTLRSLLQDLSRVKQRGEAARAFCERLYDSTVARYSDWVKNIMGGA